MTKKEFSLTFFALFQFIWLYKTVIIYLYGMVWLFYKRVETSSIGEQKQVFFCLSLLIIQICVLSSS